MMHIKAEHFTIDPTTYLKARPFPHIHIEEFLDDHAHKDLLTSLEQLEFVEKQADLFHFLQSYDLNNTDDAQLRQFIDLFTSEKTRAWLETLTGEKLGSTMDIQASIYADTHFLLCHDDQLEGRKLAFIYYLTDMEEDEGGALKLFYSANGKVLPDRFKLIRPKANSLAVFTVSDRSFHEVTEVLVDKERAALGGWLHDQ